MSEARATEQSRTASDDTEFERARVVAKIERGLADVKAGRVVPHAEVMAWFEARYSAPEVGGSAKAGLDANGAARRAKGLAT
jgi:predicted transcriptional regulator